MIETTIDGRSILEFLDDTHGIKRVHRDYENSGVFSGLRVLVLAQ